MCGHYVRLLAAKTHTCKTSLRVEAETRGPRRMVFRKPVKYASPRGCDSVRMGKGTQYIVKVRSRTCMD